MINISYLQSEKVLKDHMYITAQPLYKNMSIDFFKLHRIVKSDKVQYSPFVFFDGLKKGDNWSNDRQNLIILDIDDGFTIEQARKKFKQYKYLICTTKSHQVDKKGLCCDRFRIILQGDNVPLGDDYFIFTYGLEKLYPFIDKQVNTKTGAFLGFSNCEYWYNDGDLYDCEDLFQISKSLKEVKKVGERPTPKRVNHENDNLELLQVKTKLNNELVRDILNSNGFDVDRNFKLKLREERTPSTSISRDGLVKDFGSDFTGDVFQVLIEYRGKSFPEALEIVKNYV